MTEQKYSSKTSHRNWAFDPQPNAQESPSGRRKSIRMPLRKSNQRPGRPQDILKNPRPASQRFFADVLTKQAGDPASSRVRLTPRRERAWLSIGLQILQAE
jgi:hypothetical protein